MNGPDQQLVDQVTLMVIDALRKARASSPASIAPPAGLCTVTKSPPPSNLKSQASSLASQVSNLTSQTSNLSLAGIVTAQQLQDAIDASSDGKVRLASRARLTPLANDFARQHPQKIERLSATVTASPGMAATRSSQQAAHFSLWSSSYNAEVQQITRVLSDRLRPSVVPRSDSGLVQVIGDLAHGVADKQLDGGVLLVETAALAACYVNRNSNLRGVVGTSTVAVQQAMDVIGANVLMIESTTSPQLMRQMIEMFTQQRPQTSPHVQRQLADLHRS